MAQHLIRRLLWLPLVLVLVCLTAFSLVELIPGDPAARIAGEFATEAQIEQIRSSLGLDDPLLTRATTYMQDLLHGDLGESVVLQPGSAVTTIMRDLFPVTASLALVTLVFVFVFGSACGLAAALGRGTWIDSVASGVITLGMAVPSFVVGPVLVALLAVRFEVFPVLGYVPFAEDPWQWLWHLLLPAVALGLTPASEMARQVRSSLVGELNESYVRTARAKGLPTWRIVGKHVTKNSAIATVTVLGLQVGRLLGGSVIVETVFGIPGVGQLAYLAVFRNDFTVIRGLVLVLAALVLLTNLLVDLSYMYFDPRLRDRATR